MAVPLAVRRVLRGHAVGRCAGWRFANGATTSSGAVSGSSRGGDFRAVLLGPPRFLLRPQSPIGPVSARCGCDGPCRPDRPSCRTVRPCSLSLGATASRREAASAPVDSAAIRRCCSVYFSKQTAVRDYDRRCRSAHASAARPARSTPATISPCFFVVEHHIVKPATAPQAAQTSATASPSPPENSADCHLPSPDSSDGNTTSRSGTARARQLQIEPFPRQLRPPPLHKLRPRHFPSTFGPTFRRAPLAHARVRQVFNRPSAILQRIFTSVHAQIHITKRIPITV